MAKNTPPGPGIDSSGQTVADPTRNVEALVQAEARRQDDLRGADQLLRERETEYLKDRFDREVQHNRVLSEKDEYCKKELRMADKALAAAETARINAIRSVDVAAVQEAARVQATNAETLRKEVANSADALRAQVAATAIQNTETLTTAIAPISTAIAELREVQYKQAGQQAQVVEARDVKGESRGNVGLIITIISVAFGLIFGLIGAIATVIGIWLATRP